MSEEKDLKKTVTEKYGKIALESEEEGFCCGTGCGCGEDDFTNYTVFSEDYSQQSGYVPEADLNLGCGLPTEFAMIQKGETVVDLGSGAGNDIFIARSLTGPDGKLIGIDMTAEMNAKAVVNAKRLGYDNVEFRLGDIENMPVEEKTADIVISNCVLNLVPDKQKAFSEMFRITKPGGRFCVSDVVTMGNMPSAMRMKAELYAGCVSGAEDQEAYLKLIEVCGFINVRVRKVKQIMLPDTLLITYLTDDERKEYESKVSGLFSITVTGEKPLI